MGTKIQARQKVKLTCCRECPFYDGSYHEFPYCTHPSAKENRGIYERIVSRSHFKKDPVEKWCPIRKKEYTKVTRDAFDKIVSEKEYYV